MKRNVLLFEGLPVEVCLMIDNWKRRMCWKERVKRLEEKLVFPVMLARSNSVTYYSTNKLIIWINETGEGHIDLFIALKRRLLGRTRSAVDYLERMV